MATNHEVGSSNLSGHANKTLIPSGFKAGGIMFFGVRSSYLSDWRGTAKQSSSSV